MSHDALAQFLPCPSLGSARRGGDRLDLVLFWLQHILRRTRWLSTQSYNLFTSISQNHHLCIRPVHFPFSLLITCVTYSYSYQLVSPSGLSVCLDFSASKSNLFDQSNEIFIMISSIRQMEFRQVFIANHFCTTHRSFGQSILHHTIVSSSKNNLFLGKCYEWYGPNIYIWCMIFLYNYFNIQCGSIVLDVIMEDPSMKAWSVRHRYLVGPHIEFMGCQRALVDEIIKSTSQPANSYPRTVGRLHKAQRHRNNTSR